MAHQGDSIHAHLHQAHGALVKTESAPSSGYRSDESCEYQGGSLVTTNQQVVEEGSPRSQPNSNSEGPSQPKRGSGRKRRGASEESEEERKQRVKQNRKNINRKYYERSGKTKRDEPEHESEDVKKWRCTLLSKNTGLTPRPNTMDVDTYLEVHEKAQFLINNMGYESEDKKTNAMKLIMNE